MSHSHGLPGRLVLVATTSGRSKLIAWMCGYFCTMPAKITPELPPTSTSLRTPSNPWYFDRSNGTSLAEVAIIIFLNVTKKVGWDFMYSN